MICSLRLLYKVPLTFLLFAAGLLITAVVFPILKSIHQYGNAWDKCNQIKQIWLSCFSRIVNLKIDIKGEPVEGAALMVGNHISWLDIIAIGQFTPGFFIAKSDINHWPVIGFIVRQCGTIFIRRGNKQDIRATTEKTVWLLQQQRKVFVFPEGTTTDGTQILPFHSSLFQPALLNRSAVQPVAIHYRYQARHIAPFIGDDAFVSHLLKMLALDEIHLQLIYLPPIETTGKNRQDLATESRNAIVATAMHLPRSRARAA